jgi:iron complex outermembrane receptor protein
MTPLPSDFYFGGGSIPSSWNYPDFDKVSQNLDTSHFNLNNLESTVGNDGKPYKQFPYRISEKTDAST